MQRWYVVDAKAGRSVDVYLRLVAARFRAFQPAELKRSTVRDGRKSRDCSKGERRITRLPLFYNYIFLQAEEQDVTLGYVVSAVKAIRADVDFLRFVGSEEPATVPDELIAYYRDIPKTRSGAREVDIPPKSVVRFKEGPFGGMNAEVSRFDSATGCGVALLPLFGRLTPTPFLVGHVDIVALGRRPPIVSTLKARSLPERRAVRSDSPKTAQSA
jgi:transcription antitermination factor NusG